MHDKYNLMPTSDTTLTCLTTVSADQSLETKLLQLVHDKDAFSPNTWRNMLSAMRIWGVFAARHGYPWYPAQPAHLREWIEQMDALGLAATTIKSRLANMSILYKHLDAESPLSDQLVKRGLRILNRQRVYDGEKQGQAIPFHRVDLDDLIALWRGSSRLMELRDLAFIATSYNTLLRVAEVARIRVRDVRFNSKGATIQIGHTKTTLTSNGIVKSVSPTVAVLMRQWIDAAKLHDNPDSMLFCRVHRVNKAIPTDKAITNPNTIAIFERAWLALEKPREDANKGRYETWTGHSARVGACIDLLESGASLEQIMLEGNWSSPGMVLHYLRHALAGKSLMTALMSDE